jgi:hypothetical protein
MPMPLELANLAMVWTLSKKKKLYETMIMFKPLKALSLIYFLTVSYFCIGAFYENTSEEVAKELEKYGDDTFMTYGGRWKFLTQINLVNNNQSIQTLENFNQFNVI